MSHGRKKLVPQAKKQEQDDRFKGDSSRVALLLVVTPVRPYRRSTYHGGRIILICQNRFEEVWKEKQQMLVRYNKSAKSSTLHIDTKEQAIKFASDLLNVAQKDEAFPGTTVAIFEKPKAEGKQQFAQIAVLAGKRRR